MRSARVPLESEILDRFGDDSSLATTENQLGEWCPPESGGPEEPGDTDI